MARHTDAHAPALDAGRETLAEFVEEWWKLHAEPNLAPRTLAVYASLWDVHVLPELGGLPLRQVTPEACQRFAGNSRRRVSVRRRDARL